MTDTGFGDGVGVAEVFLASALFVIAITVAVGGVAGATAGPPDVGVEYPALQSNGTVDDRSDDGSASDPPVRHEDPDEYAERSDLEGLEDRLIEDLVDRLATATEATAQSEYGDAETALGEPYEDRLEQYADVAGETNGQGHESLFAETRAESANLLASARTFEETSAAYEDARRAGDEERVRTLALEIDELAVDIGESATSVRERYGELEATVGIDRSASAESLTELTAAVEQRRDEIRATEFTETVLTIDPDREGESISFLDPLHADGRVLTAEGDPIANEEIRLEIDADAVTAETDSAGRFELEYRPTNASASATTLEVRFAPEPPAPYLGNATRVDVSIEPVTPAVSNLETPAETAYGETLPVSGELAVEGVPVDGLALEVHLGGERVGNLTVADGRFDGTATVPAAVPDGERELAVVLPAADRALAGVVEPTAVNVRETETTVSVDAATDGEDSIRASGMLATAGGGPIGDQSVTLVVDGEPVRNVSTAADGTYDGTVAVPNATAEDATVSAVYDGTGTNLAAVRAETTVGLGSGAAGSSPLSTGVLVGGALGLLAAGLLVIRYRRRSTTADSSPDRVTIQDETREARDEEPAETADRSTVRAHLAAAEDHLSNGRPDAAVIYGYEAVRRDLSARVEGAEGLTHWELYRRYRRRAASDEPTEYGGREAAIDALCDLTEWYERAAFTRDALPESEAVSALELARRFCEYDDTDRPETIPTGG